MSANVATDAPSGPHAGTASAPDPRRTAADLPEHLDVVIVGAGISGIGLACRLQESLPLTRYAVLEAREASGGTWDLFRYPGVRSDSDMYTLSFPFAPWRGRKAIADGGDILDYLRQTAAQHGVDERIHYGCRVSALSWSTPDQRWSVEVTSPDGSTREITASHVHLAAGYYDYDSPHDPQIPGLEDFAGQVVHPQRWTDDVEHEGAKVVVIGSGATAVSLVPALAESAASVTMLQRSPTYVFTLPGTDKVIRAAGEVLPKKVAHRLGRAKNIGVQGFFYRLSRVSPKAAKAVVHGDMARRLPREDIREHFSPRYDVWDQRLCVVPDGDLFTTLRTGSARIVTGHIDRVVPEGIRLKDGQLLEADLIVTATGLRLKALGGVAFSVDGQPFSLRTAFAYRGLMVAGLPNLTLSIGYINASWTLRADLVSRYVVRLLTHLRDQRLGVAMAVAPEGMSAGPILDLASGYISRSIGGFPKVGDHAPWTMPQSYMRDVVAFARADVTEAMYFAPRGEDRPLPPTAHAPATLPDWPEEEAGQTATVAPTDAPVPV